jgi:hypothetical protein
MARLHLLLVAFVAFTAIVAVAAAPYDIDENALLAELENRVPTKAQSLLSFDDLPAESLALLEADAKESIEAAELLNLSKPAAAAAKAEAVTLLKKDGDVELGVDFWTINSARGVYNKAKGTIIGNIPADAELVIEHYAFTTQKDLNGKDDSTQWGYGFVTKPEGFGGWAGENACGWFPLQRVNPKIQQNGTLKSNVPNHPPKCPDHKLTAPNLTRSKLLKQGSYLKDGGIVKAVTKNECAAFLNYDPTSQTPLGPAPPLAAGTFSGKNALGVVPAGIAQSKKVDDFGVQYVTKDGKYAMVKYKRLDPVNPGFSHFFVDCSCLEFDTKAVAATNEILAKDDAKKGEKLINKQKAKEAADKKTAEKAAKAQAKAAKKAEKKAKKDAKKAAAKPAAPAPAAAKLAAAVSLLEMSSFGASETDSDVAGAAAISSELEADQMAEFEAGMHAQQAVDADSKVDSESEDASEQESEVADASEFDAQAEEPSTEFMQEQEPQSLMEVSSQSTMTATVGLDNPTERGNYPGWQSMIEEQAEALPAAAPVVPEPSFKMVQPKPAHKLKLPKEGENVKHVTLGQRKASAVLRHAKTGIKKVHVHVYGKADADVDRERRLQMMVRRLANKQSESYKKINALIKKLKSCADSDKDCLKNYTEKLEDWKAEWTTKQ